MQRSRSPSREARDPFNPAENHRQPKPQRQRNAGFHPTRHPLKDHPLLRIEHHRTTGALPFFNPTRAHFQAPGRPTHIEPSPRAEEEGGLQRVLKPTKLVRLLDREHTIPGVSYKWTSRNNRKGRHAITLSSFAPEAKQAIPPLTNSFTQTLSGVWRMFTQYPVWDISYDVATVFTLGSVIWVTNAFFVFLPLVQPDTEFKNEELYGGGITALIGATVFEFGSVLLLAEAVNENRAGCFGWALEKAMSDGADGLRLRPSKSGCTHHHYNKRNLVGKGAHGTSAALEQSPSSFSSTSSTTKTWVWFPTIQDLRSHYLRDLGFIASFAQLIGATIFWVSGFTALPGIYDRMSPTIKIIFFWTPQVLGGTGFIVSGTLFMLETQSRWYKPAFGTLGWWIGMWNLIGGIGFTLCPAFGYDEDSWAQYQACLSTFWGSWAFLIGSVIQWYESLDKFPVEVDSASESSGNEQ
ncbi:hypothetical protein P154DRAFT_558828 [Amniculicola lignicola CBS 123094]|uniref:Integral membrane protein n=1 Tax=Amniculicola lignicola CBS 123094 TaxID=1392246 RepID=A0A6A5X059_9PLEO|nr:hypothetical protein P154DRAFT_558828 [Amniculicola lignicola CBS 123094]